MAEEGDDLAGADAMAAEAAADAPPPPKAEESKQEEPKSEEPKKQESAPAPSKSESSSSSSSSAEPRAEGARIFASPLARRLAQEQGIPLAKVQGSGPGGRIVKTDIEAYKPSQSSTDASASPAASAPKASSSSAGASAPAAGAPADYTDSPTTNMRRVIASRLTQSKQELPHYYVSIDVEMDRVLKLRAAFNEASDKKAGADRALAKAAKLSVGDFITKAAAVALREVPEVNAAWMGDFVRR